MDMYFSTVPAPNSTAANPSYLGIVQHTSILNAKQTYERLAAKLGYTSATISAAFKALARVIKNNMELGCASKFDGVTSVRINCSGGFASLQGPWVKGKNLLTASAAMLDPFKNTLTGIIPINRTEGAKPVINSVFDEVTSTYDIITGIDQICIAGSDLAVDTTKADEGVWLVSATGVETKMTVATSDVQIIRAALNAPLTAGAYTLVVRTRSGMGEEYGVAEAKRKVAVA